METTLLFGDFFWIAIIMMVFGGGSSYLTNGSEDTEKLEKLNEIIEKLNKLNDSK